MTQDRPSEAETNDEPGSSISRPSGWPRLLWINLLASAFIFALLEVWRPCFFLTDDNLDCYLPFFCEVGTRLLSGQSPFVSEHLFGGEYSFLHDPVYFLWHPLYLAVSLLAGTPFRFWMIDIDAFFLLMLSTSGFTALACHLRRELSLTIGDGWITFYTLSFTYSMMVLTSGASWLAFLGNQSALPWLALGILQGNRRRGIGLVALFSLHQFLAGHFSPTLSTTIFLTLFAIGLALSRRSFLPLANWLIGCGVALIIILPLLFPALEGFLGSSRFHGVSLGDMQKYNIDFLQFPNSLFLGTAFWMIFPGADPRMTYILALGSCAAAWCLLPALANLARGPWRGLEVVTFVMLLFVGTLIVRPVWVSEIMLDLPFFRSMRWPFRDLLQFQFFLHLFLVIHKPGLGKTVRYGAALFGTAAMVIPMVLFPTAPTFNPMTWDRQLLLNGGFERYWSQVGPLLKPGDRYAVIIPADVQKIDPFAEPYSLLGTYNYAQLAGVVNISGYSPTAPGNGLGDQTEPSYFFGAYLPEQKASLLAEYPDLKFITLESVRPLKITYSSGTVTVDLTGYVPAK